MYFKKASIFQKYFYFFCYKNKRRQKTKPFSLILLNFLPLNYVYCLLLPLSIAQIFICFKLSKVAC